MGDGMRKYVKTLDEIYRSREFTDETVEEFLRHLAWIQHERLVHLMVLSLTSIIFLIVIALVLKYESNLLILLCLILAILNIFYIRHYFFLENTIQAWYRLYDKKKPH